MNKSNIVIIFGTRPEILKLCKLVKILSKSKFSDRVILVNTNQHREVLDSELIRQNIKVDIDLNIDFRLDLKAKVAETLKKTIASLHELKDIEYIIAQGDTNTALVASIYAFLSKIKFLHIEAGLRTYDLSDPFPEEFNRRVAAIGAYYHFAPTKDSVENLLDEGIPANRIICTGNTILDLLYDLRIIEDASSNTVDVLVSSHRRETTDNERIDLIDLLSKKQSSNTQIRIKWISHHNYSYNLLESIRKTKIELIDAVSYYEMATLYSKANLVVTDSGGITEECITLGIPAIIYRHKSERYIPDEIKKNYLISKDICDIDRWFDKMITLKRIPSSYYGDGQASSRIYNWLSENIRNDSV